ncbi:hypothetical protein KCG45_01475 [Erythrobacter sp. WH131]|uniref:Uncharacterized protein n=2 Tax=Erythrobacter ani TaxID=2827235 RepID=A0ABS6SIK5_9SPHN|nr:hypothetical protein [Erythrobacter ani]
MNIPQRGADGMHLTVNRSITEDEKVWYFRSGWNVAALNCTAPQYQPILDGYSAYIKDHARTLKRLNDRIDQMYRQQGSSRRQAMRTREAQMTSVYNYWALPPARAGFCRAALDMSNRAMAAPPEDAVAFALANFDALEAPFEKFFAEYQEYRQLSADWDAKYGRQYGPSQPGWVAVQTARANGAIIPTVGASAPTATLASPSSVSGTVVQSQSGAEVPVVPVDENVVSQPVVEPIPSDGQAAATAPAPRGIR